MLQSQQCNEYFFNPYIMNYMTIQLVYKIILIFNIFNSFYQLHNIHANKIMVINQLHIKKYY